jgi:hypothetical protein
VVTREALRRSAPLLEAAALLLLARSEAIRAAVPGVGLFTGPLGGVLLAVAVGLTVVRWRGRPPRIGVPPTFVLLLAPAALSAAIGIYYVTNVDASGDEIDYLMMTQSIWREGDLDLRDNFTREDFREFVAGVHRMPGGTRRADGRPFPTHSSGLPFLIAPVYALGGRVACVVFLAIAAAALGLVVRGLARQAGADEEASLLAWAATVGPPVFFYTHFVYTEVVCTLAIALALYLLVSSPRPAGAVVAALALGTLPWLHVKMGLVCVVLGVFALVRLRGRARLAFALTAAVMAIVYLGYFWVIFGRPNPFALYGAQVPKPMARMTPGRTILGVFLDGGFGLLVYAPVFVLGLLGLPLLLGRSNRDRWAWGLTVVAVMVPVLAWKNWWGFSPPARFLVPAVPVLAVAAAVRVARRPTSGLVRWRWPLVGAGVALALLMSAEPREMRMINTRDGPLMALELLDGEASPARYLARLTSRRGTERPPWRPPVAEVRVALVWVAAILLLAVLDRLARGRERVDRAFRGLALPVGLLLLVTLGVDYWARAPGAETGPESGSPSSMDSVPVSPLPAGETGALGAAFPASALHIV